MRLGILRSSSLVRANLGAMALFGSWVGFQFIATLYMQQLRGWSALETGLAIFPAGVLVAVISTRIAPLVMRFGVTRLIVAGLISIVAGYALFLPIGLDSSYAAGDAADVPAHGPRLRARVRAAQHRRDDRRRARASRVSPAVSSTRRSSSAARSRWPSSPPWSNANTGAGGSPQALLDGFKPALIVPLIVAVLGILAVAPITVPPQRARGRRRPRPTSISPRRPSR